MVARRPGSQSGTRGQKHTSKLVYKVCVCVCAVAVHYAVYVRSSAKALALNGQPAHCCHLPPCSWSVAEPVYGYRMGMSQPELDVVLTESAKVLQLAVGDSRTLCFCLSLSLLPKKTSKCAWG